MKTIHLFLATSLLSAATAVLAVWACLRVIGHNQRLTEEASELRQQANLQAIEVRRMLADAEALSARIEAERLSTAAQPDVAAQPKPPTDGVERAAPLRAGRVRIVSGDRNVGGGWLVPVAAMPGAVSTESVVVLDESVRQALSASGRAAPEREVYRETSTTYYPSYPYYWGYPIYISDGRPQPPVCPTNLPPPPPSGKVLLPETGKPFLNTQFYMPSAKPFLPPVPASSFGSPAGVNSTRAPLQGTAQPRRPAVGGR